MQAAHPAIRLQDADPVAVLAILIAALHAQHPAAGGVASRVSGPVGIGEGTGGWRTLPARRWRITFAATPGLRLRAAGGQQTRQRQKRQPGESP